MDSRRVLLIGKRASVLTRLAEALTAQGIETERCQDPAGASALRDRSGNGNGNGNGFGVVAFGRAIKSADREWLRKEFAQADPEVVFVDGYAPIVPLLVAQFEQALDRRPLGQRAVVDAAVRGGIVDVELRSPCRLRILSYRLGALYRTHERPVFDRDVAAGAHSAALGARSARSHNAFVVIRAADETVALPVS